MISAIKLNDWLVQRVFDLVHIISVLEYYSSSYTFGVISLNALSISKRRVISPGVVHKLTLVHPILAHRVWHFKNDGEIL
jgi:hypothetical protein